MLLSHESAQIMFRISQSELLCLFLFVKRKLMIDLSINITSSCLLD